MACSLFRTIILSKARFDFGFIFQPGSLLSIKPHISASYFKVFIGKAKVIFTFFKKNLIHKEKRILKSGDAMTTGEVLRVSLQATMYQWPL